MLVVAEQRSGATKFCQDLAAKHNLKFENELAAFHIKDLHFDGKHDIKEFHEAGKFDFLDFQTFYDMHENMDDYVVLMNQFSNMLGFDRADHFVMRKSTKDSLLSWVNYQLKLYHIAMDKESRGMGTEYLAFARRMCIQVIRSSYMISQYCLSKNITPIWYEHLEYSKPVNTYYLDKLVNKDEVMNMVNLLLESANIEPIKKQLQEK